MALKTYVPKAGPAADQAQLHGLFAKLRDLGLEIISLDAG